MATLPQSAPFRALSLWQPFASLVAHGCRRYVALDWRPKDYRGRIAIHAARRWTARQESLCAQPGYREALASLGLVGNDLPRGAIVGYATLTDVVPREGLTLQPDGSLAPEKWPAGVVLQEADVVGAKRWAWLLERAVPLPCPLPLCGHLGLFPLPEMFGEIDPDAN